MTVRLTGPEGAATETVLTDVNSGDQRVIDLLEAGQDVQTVITIKGAEPSIIKGVQSLQREAMGIYDDDHEVEDPQKIMLRLLSYPIERIGARTLATNTLRNNKYQHIWQVVQRTEAELYSIKGLGTLSLNSIKSALQKLFADAGVPLEDVFGLDLERYQDELPTPEG